MFFCKNSKNILSFNFNLLQSEIGQIKTILYLFLEFLAHWDKKYSICELILGSVDFSRTRHLTESLLHPAELYFSCVGLWRYFIIWEEFECISYEEVNCIIRVLCSNLYFQCMCHGWSKPQRRDMSLDLGSSEYFSEKELFCLSWKSEDLSFP